MKKALVLTGGGVRGAFQVGVLLHVLVDRGEQFDIITGASVGALNGGFLAQYKKEDQAKGIGDLLTMWQGVSNETIKKHWTLWYLEALWRSSLYDSSPLESLVDRQLDAHKIATSGVKLSVSAVSLDTGLSHQFAETCAEIKDAVKASAAFPVFFKPVKIYGEDFVDGAVRDVAPLKEAIAMGATHITIINTGPLKMAEVIGANLKTLSVALRSIDIMNTEIMENDLASFIQTNNKLDNGTLQDSEKRIIDYVYFGPERELADDPLEFDPKKIREMIQKGYNKALEHYGESPSV